MKRLLMVCLVLFMSCELTEQKTVVKPKTVVVRELVSFSIDFGSKYGGDLVLVNDKKSNRITYKMPSDNRCWEKNDTIFTTSSRPEDVNYCKVQVHLNSKILNHHKWISIQDGSGSSISKSIDQSGNMYLYKKNLNVFSCYGGMFRIIGVLQYKGSPNHIADTIQVAIIDSNITDSMILQNPSDYNSIRIGMNRICSFFVDTSIPFPGFAN